MCSPDKGESVANLIKNPPPEAVADLIANPARQRLGLS